MIKPSELTAHRTIEISGSRAFQTVFESPAHGWLMIDGTIYVVTKVIDDRHLEIAVPKSRIAHLN